LCVYTGVVKKLVWVEISMKKQVSVLGLLWCAALSLSTLVAAPPANLSEALAKLDAASSGFTGVRAQLQRSTYTSIVKVTETESGEFLLRKKGSNVVARMDMTTPNRKTFVFKDKKLEIYYPNQKMVEEFDLGKARKLVDQLVLLGFGTTSKDLLASYDVTWNGIEKIGGTAAFKLTLKPKNKEAQAQLNRVEVWFDAENANTIQQVFLMPNNDKTTAMYSQIRRNPDLPDSVMSLSVPAGVTRNKPQSIR
jgi:outer membrane lipoprotein-sorting protein